MGRGRRRGGGVDGREGRGAKRPGHRRTACCQHRFPPHLKARPSLREATRFSIFSPTARRALFDRAYSNHHDSAPESTSRVRRLAMAAPAASAALRTATPCLLASFHAENALLRCLSSVPRTHVSMRDARMAENAACDRHAARAEDMRRYAMRWTALASSFPCRALVSLWSRHARNTSPRPISRDTEAWRASCKRRRPMPDARSLFFGSSSPLASEWVGSRGGNADGYPPMYGCMDAHPHGTGLVGISLGLVH